MYEWIIVTAGIFAFTAACGIGANDAANSFATSIGSKALKVKQAIFVAVIMETSGAIIMGSHVSKTIRKGIADYKCFQDDPYVLMYGCMVVCLSVGIWLFLASKYEMPVSTTHSAVGGMIGMTMALKGSDCVIWYEDKDTFPYVGGVSGIILSWVISPVFSFIISCGLFWLTRTVVLRSQNSFNRIFWYYPFIIAFTLSLNAFYIVYKGAKGMDLDDISLGEASIYSFSIGIGITFLTLPFIPKIKQMIEDKFDPEKNTNPTPTHNIDTLSITTPKLSKEELSERNIFFRIYYYIKTAYSNDDIHTDTIEKDECVNDIHNNAEKFDEKTEELFKYLQVFTACCDSFSHGANDVANAMGPFMAAYVIYETGKVSKKADPGDDVYWILTIGGIGIGLGLLLYGYKIIKALGVKICKITPTRGVAIELASALVIISGSRLEIPLSTTHCQVGATLGVAALEDVKGCHGINCNIVLKAVIGWIATLVAVGGSTALLVSQGAYAPEV